MELNGIANVHMLAQMLESIVDESSNNGNAHERDEAIKTYLRDIYNELELLERYMVICKKNVNSDKLPKWHELKANPNSFPTLKEEINLGDGEG